MHSGSNHNTWGMSFCSRQNRTRFRRGGFAALLMAFTTFISLNITTSMAFAAATDSLEKTVQNQATLPKGYHISLFAHGLRNARLIVQTRTGDLIVSSRGSNLFLVSDDRDKDGRADQIRTLMKGLNQPHGILLDQGWLYIAEEHQVSRVRFDANKNTVSGVKEIVLSGLPNDGGHSTRTLKKGPDGWFYLSIGSSCNVCREANPWRAAILRFHADKKAPPQIYASGLRNTVGFDWQPGTGQLYGVENGRDWLGDDFPPDELNRIEPNGFYGWPYRHGNNVPDPTFGQALKKPAQSPAFSFDAHIAPLSIRFLQHQKTADMQNVALVAQHGSWNRSAKNGYRIVSLHFHPNGTVSRKLFLTGFLQGQKVVGRPVDIFERLNGNLLISDDYNGALWLVRLKE